jgi:hypothetical protein
MGYLLKKRITVLPLQARTMTTRSPIQTDANTSAGGFAGILVFLRITVSGGTGVKVLIRGYAPDDPQFAQPAVLNAGGTNAATAGIYLYLLYPGVTLPATGTNVQDVTSGFLPSNFDLNIVHSDGASYTYGVSYELLP